MKETGAVKETVFAGTHDYWRSWKNLRDNFLDDTKWPVITQWIDEDENE